VVLEIRALGSVLAAYHRYVEMGEWACALKPYIPYDGNSL